MKYMICFEAKHYNKLDLDNMTDDERWDMACESMRTGKFNAWYVSLDEWVKQYNTGRVPESGSLYIYLVEKDLEEIRKDICALVRALQISNDKQMVACWGDDGTDNYWLLSPEVSNCINIPLAIWHSDSGMVQKDKEFNDWQEMVAWLFEKITDGCINKLYVEYL